MIDFAINFAFGCFGTSLLLNLWRILRADGVCDRVLALDTMVINVIALIVLFGMQNGSGIIFESALIISMLGFVSTVAYTRFMLRGNIIE
jgi:multicomponent K+:H+ antiporter subunit F